MAEILNKKVLIIDDDLTLQTVFKSVLSAHGATVVMAMTGEEGLSAASAEKPDIILLDIILPKMKGREVCQKLKESDDTKNIPVIFLTAKSSEEDEKVGRELGAVGHIVKPVYPARVIKEIKKALGL